VVFLCVWGGWGGGVDFLSCSRHFVSLSLIKLSALLPCSSFRRINKVFLFILLLVLFFGGVFFFVGGGGGGGSMFFHVVVTL